MMEMFAPEVETLPSLPWGPFQNSREPGDGSMVPATASSCCPTSGHILGSFQDVCVTSQLCGPQARHSVAGSLLSLTGQTKVSLDWAPLMPAGSGANLLQAHLGCCQTQLLLVV